MDNNNIYISGYTTPSVEDIDVETSDSIIESGVTCYDAYNLIDMFHTDEFEIIFKNNIYTILSFKPNDIIIICKMLLNKILQHYNYNVNPEPVFVDIEEVVLFFNFVKFLEFDSISFLQNLCTELNMSANDIAETKIISSKIESRDIINHIDILANNYKYNKYIHSYLLNQSKEEMIKWVNKMFYKHKADVVETFI